MEPDDLQDIDILVRSGFFGRADLLRIMGEEKYEPGQLDPVELAMAVDESFIRYAAEQEHYPEVTDCDRLDDAFAALNKQGVITLANAGMTQSDGYEDFCAAFDRSPNRDAVLGYCFYHGQDRDRAVLGGGLYLAFGPTKDRDETTDGPEVGRIVQTELERVGFEVEWDGSFGHRIKIPHFDWQRRSSVR